MGQYLEKYKKNIAIDMRKRGLSYSDIENRIHVPRSTLSFWLSEIKLPDELKKKLEAKRMAGIKKASAKRILKLQKNIQDIKTSSAKNIKQISKKELWLIGVVLYWRERLLSGSESDIRKGVKFTSSDPYLVKLFLKWLKDIGGIKNNEIDFDIFMSDVDKGNKAVINEAISFWSEVTEFPENWFTKIYYHKSKQKRKRGGRNTKKNKFGLLRTRVKASSMMARQIAGWVRGIIKYYWD